MLFMFENFRKRRGAPTGDQIRLAGLLVMVMGLSLFSRHFLTVRNLFDILSSAAVLGILATGLLIVLIAGEIDISFAAITTVAQYVAALITIDFGGNWLTMFAVALLIAVGLEMLNALLVHYLRAMSIIVTIATMNVFYGLLNFFSNGQWLYDFPDWFSDGIGFGLRFPGGAFAQFNLAIIGLIVFWVLGGIMLTKLVIGRRLYAVGGSKESAHHVGFSILGTRLFAFGAMGVASGVAAIVHAQLVQTVAPNALVGMELEVLTAVVLGGASLVGGVGTFRGMICGVAFIALIRNGLTLLKIDSYYHTLLLGMLILGSVTGSSLGDVARRRTLRL
jgi:simple sugar transport system permease protein